MPGYRERVKLVESAYEVHNCDNINMFCVALGQNLSCKLLISTEKGLSSTKLQHLAMPVLEA